MSMETGRHLHHALRGHGGEGIIRKGKEELKVDEHEPTTNTVYEYRGLSGTDALVNQKPSTVARRRRRRRKL